MSAREPADQRLDHVVVVMFENHSFDNLLGGLYDPSEVRSFEGVRGRSWANAPPLLPEFAGAGPVLVHPATSLATPFPDPGEEYPHVNTQLFGSVDPESNRYAEVDQMRAPFNSPPTGAGVPPMAGFVIDYVNAFRVAVGRLPTRDEYAQIMAYFTAEQAPVLSGLARGFACFDHWFCDVPSQTYPNRSFFHAASSSGFVLNGPSGKFESQNDAPTVFERLESAGRSWRVYFDPAQLVAATALIHARRLASRFATHFRSIYDFYEEAARGELPNYSFIEPNMFHPHTDMHPHSGARFAHELGLRPPDILVGGEVLLARVYETIRASSVEPGSNWRNTFLLVTFDEHGGTYDHVPPPSTVPPGDRTGELGFGFDRLGVRVPTIAISAWTDERVVVSERFQGTSLIRTLRDWWQLGSPLTARDGSAPSFLPVLSRASPREPERWPTVVAHTPGLLEQAEEKFLRSVEALISPMERLERDLLGEVLAHEARKKGSGVLPLLEGISHRDAHEHFRRIGQSLFPQIHL